MRSTKFYSILLVLSTLIVTILGKKRAAKDQDTDIIDKLLQKRRTLSTHLAISPILYLGDGNFTKYVVDRPREYYAMLLFTATAPQYQCSVCVKTKGAYIDAATHYQNQYDFEVTPADKKMIFFVVEVDSARSVFSDMQLETVPRVYVLPPTQTKSPKMKIGDFEVEAKVLLDGTKSILDEIESISGIKIDVMVDPVPCILALCLVSLLVALFVSNASYDVYGALLWYQSPRLWVLVSAVCFAVGVSGSIFCVIRAAPPLGHGRQGAVVFAGQGRDQYLVEGLVVAAWTLGVGLSLFLMLAATRMKRFPLLRHCAVLLALSVCAVLLLQIWDAYVMKTGWYSLKETLPAEVWSFLTSSVKKGSGLPKRLLRMSEYWLLESRSWEAFSKKFQVLVVDYLKRQLLGKGGSV